MFAEPFAAACSKKSFELGYALFRTSSVTNHKNFAKHLEEQALSLIVAASLENYPEARKALSAAQSLIRLGEGIGIVSISTSRTILNEIGVLSAMIADMKSSTPPSDIDFSEIFSSRSNASDGQVKKRKFSNIEDVVAARSKIEEIRNEDINRHSSGQGTSGDDSAHNAASSETRQSSMLEKIRQSGNCRIKEIQEVFPGVSERTIRYDLQGLIEKGLIERIGLGGPGTYYRASQFVSGEPIS